MCAARGRGPCAPGPPPRPPRPRAAARRRRIHGNLAPHRPARPAAGAALGSLPVWPSCVCVPLRPLCAPPLAWPPYKAYLSCPRSVRECGSAARLSARVACVCPAARGACVYVERVVCVRPKRRARARAGATSAEKQKGLRKARTTTGVHLETFGDGPLACPPLCGL